MTYSNDDVTPGYYAGLADELDLLAQSVRKHPDLNSHFAQRLQELARQIREDVRLMTFKKVS